MTTIGQDTSTGERVRRSFGTSMTHLAKVLFSSSNSFFDATLIFKKIGELATTKLTATNLAENQIRLIQTTIGEITKSVRNISVQQENIERNYKLLDSQVNKNMMTINSLLVKTTLLEQSVILESLLNQYAYETQNLISIINSVVHGKINFTILPSSRFLKDLQAIKLTLPAGTQLPLEPTTQNIPEFLSISSISIIQKDTILIFALSFPIVNVNGYDMYRPISLPFYIEGDNAIFIETENDYISFSDDSEYYFTLTQQQHEACTRLGFYTICRSSKPIHRRASSTIYEIKILRNPQTLQISCKGREYA